MKGDAWLQESAKYGANPKEVPIILCSNKIDKNKRIVSEDEGRRFALSRGLIYYELSASSGQNVNEMFDYLFAAVIKQSNLFSS